MGTRIGRHLRSQFVGYIALVLAMSGTAYAIGANSIGDKQLANNSVGSSEIEPDAVKTSDLQEGSVGAAQLARSGDCGYIGQILHFGFSYAPEGTLPADGSLQSIRQYPALFSLYGTSYGGDGQTEFALPKLASADGTTRYAVCIDGEFPVRP